MTVRMRYTPTLAAGPEHGEWTIEQVTVHDPDPMDGIWAGFRESKSTATGTLPWLHELVTSTVADADAEGDQAKAAAWRHVLDEIDGHMADAI